MSPSQGRVVVVVLIIGNNLEIIMTTFLERIERARQLCPLLRTKQIKESSSETSPLTMADSYEEIGDGGLLLKDPEWELEVEVEGR